MPHPRALYVADHASAEFAPEVEWLATNADVTWAASQRAAVDIAAADSPPLDVIVVGQLRGGEVPLTFFESLRAAAPLVPIVSLLGSFCEGENRTAKTWPGAVRVYAHQFIGRMQTQFVRLAAGGVMAWSPPFTLTDEDRLMRSMPLPPQTRPARIGVVSQQQAAASALCDAITIGEHLVISRGRELEGGANPELIVWDCKASFAADRGIFKELVARTKRVPKLVVLGFPRVEDRTMALADGAEAVVSKPFELEDLLGQIRKCLSNGPTPRSS
jgi:CheY-like chemotaxis protein